MTEERKKEKGKKEKGKKEKRKKGKKEKRKKGKRKKEKGKRKKEKGKRNAPTETGPLPQSHALDLFVIRVRDSFPTNTRKKGLDVPRFQAA